MAWIESHQALERHPKTTHLMSLMEWDLDTTIGKLHRFWWWCLDYAPDGDLRKFNDRILAASVGLNGTDSKRFVEAMITARWLDRDPYFRVHDWWMYARNFLQGRWNKTPELWRKIEKLYSHPPGRRKVATNHLSTRRKVETPQHPPQRKEEIFPPLDLPLPTVTNLPTTSPPSPPPPAEEGETIPIPATNQPQTSHHDTPWGTPEALVALYNAQAPDECPAVEILSPARRKKAHHYLTQFPQRAFWEEACKEIHLSALLRGLRPGAGHEYFRATFDWLLTKGRDGTENVVKVQEGRYRDAEKK